MGQSLGWDVFSLDYRVDAPLNTILTPSVMGTYLKIFNFLWKIKRVEYSLTTLWRQNSNLARTRGHEYSAYRNASDAQLHRYCGLESEMIHFISNLQHYIMFEVLEISWEEFVTDLKKATGEHTEASNTTANNNTNNQSKNNTTHLDYLIEAHNKYLNNILEKSLLSLQHQQLLHCLWKILGIIIQFCTIQSTLFQNWKSATSVDTEDADAQDDNENIRNKPKSKAKEKRTTTFVTPTVPPDVKLQLNKVAEEYHHLMHDLMASLAKQSDPSMRFLTWRLDFNFFYEKQLRGKNDSNIDANDEIAL